MKRLIQITKFINTEPKKGMIIPVKSYSLFVGFTRKSWQKEEIVSVSYKPTFLSQRKYYICKVIFKDKLQYNLEILNDGI